jgi:hypothetical protein
MLAAARPNQVATPTSKPGRGWRGPTSSWVTRRRPHDHSGVLAGLDPD